jgi:hypothetical protein
MKHVFILLLVFGCTFAQETEIPSENYFWQYNYTENVEGIIGVKNCYVRSEASANSILLDSVQIGQNVKILKNTITNANIKGLNLSWVSIEYTKNNKILNGYLWKGFLAINSAQNKQNTFLTTLDRKFSKKVIQNNEVDEVTVFGLTVRVLDNNNQLVTEKSFTKQMPESYSSFSSVIDNWGLQNLKSIYRMGVGGEACGIPIEYIYYGFTGTELLALPEKYDVGDANAYYHSENFIFPKEKGGKANTIIKEITDAENINYDSNNNVDIFLTKKTIEYYNWDGKNFKLTQTKKLKPYKEKM